MVDINEIYGGGALLKTSDLRGKRIRLKIASYRIQEFTDNKGKKTNKIVLAFVGKEKEWAAPKTSALLIGAILGSDPATWVGHDIELYPDKTPFTGGSIVDCIRASVPVPVVAEEDDEAVPF